MLKEYNLDPLYSIVDSLNEEQNLKIIEFIKNNPQSYASMYYFNQSLLNNFRLKPDSLLSNNATHIAFKHYGRQNKSLMTVILTER